MILNQKKVLVHSILEELLHVGSYWYYKISVCA